MSQLRMFPGCHQASLILDPPLSLAGFCFRSPGTDEGSYPAAVGDGGVQHQRPLQEVPADSPTKRGESHPLSPAVQ